VQALFWGDLNVIGFIIIFLNHSFFKIWKINAENRDDTRILLYFVGRDAG
jgi:hypothetical protein